MTLLFTDVEGSTRLLREQGPRSYARVLGEHRRLLRNAFLRRGGVEVDTQGDAFFVAFPTAAGAVAAAAEAQRALRSGPIRVRIGIHTGAPLLTEEGYVGEDVHLGARIAAAGHGGQVLLSQTTRDLIEAEVADLGEHRLKDFGETVTIFQLGSARFPPLKTISNTNLPRPTSSFLGRRQEVADVVALVREGARLVTLSGPGGSGKTRLAIEAAAELVGEFKAGVFWVGLAAVRDPSLVIETVARTVGAEDGLAAWIGDRELLLLLDNLEQVVESASDLAALVEGCPNLSVLVTSRELLRVRGEVEYEVLPLAAPDAVALFTARAKVDPDDAVAELCRRLDNLPLALELAAARTKVLSPDQILDRLTGRLDLFAGGRDADARQRTLRATIAWSHDLLADAEARLFARLSVFRGGCTLAGAEAVVDAGLDDLQSLVEKSLLRHSGERFWMLETIREYAGERLREIGDAAGIARRYATHYLAVAEEAAPHLGDAQPKLWLDRLEAEHDNLRAALEYFEAEGLGESQQRLTGALWRFWQLRGHVAEAARRLDAALRASSHPTQARADTLMGAAANVVAARSDYETAKRWAGEALELCRALAYPWGIAYSRFLVGYAAVEGGDFASAVAPLEESLELFLELGDERFVGVARFNLVWALEETGERERAHALGEQNLRDARARGDARLETFALDELEALARQEGRHGDALILQAQAMRILRDEGSPVQVADTLSRFAASLAGLGRAGPAARLLSRSLAAYEDLAIDVPRYNRVRNDETLAALHGRLDRSLLAEAFAEGRKLTIDEAVELALAEAREHASKTS